MMTDDTRQIRVDSNREHAPIVKLSIDWRFAGRKGKEGRVIIEGTVSPAAERLAVALWNTILTDSYERKTDET